LVSERELAGAFGPERSPGFGAMPGPPPALVARTARPSESATPPLQEVEREHILEVLRQVNGNRMAAAKVLGISRRALYRRLDRHGITEAASGRRAGRRV